MSRELTADEVQRAFLDHVWRLISYWASEHGSNVDLGLPARERLSGFAHSLLVAIDGASANLPAFILAPEPHPDDRQYCIDEGENWWPENRDVELNADISGGLHELLYHYRCDHERGVRGPGCAMLAGREEDGG
jgi:hypothetical protein